jgi:hypothetical protein
MSQSTYSSPVAEHPLELPPIARLSEIDHYLSQALREQQDSDAGRKLGNRSVWQDSQPCP